LWRHTACSRPAISEPESNGLRSRRLCSCKSRYTQPGVADTQSNREGVEATLNEALDWEKRSGATFEADKTAIIHLAPKAYKPEQGCFTIKRQTVEPKDHVNILGILMDTKLKYKEHIARAASKGLEAGWSFDEFGVYPQRQRQRINQNRSVKYGCNHGA
jgi:hypothetical protein